METSSSQPGLTALSSALSSPWDFLRPTRDLHATVTNSAKHILDPLAASVVDAQSTRRQINKKRKRSEPELDSNYPQLQLKSLYVNGFTSNQIWEQATRILESAGDELERDITLIATPDDLSSTAEGQEISDPEGTGSDIESLDNLPEDISEGASEDGDTGTEDISDTGSNQSDQEEAGIASEIDDEELSEGENSNASAGEPETYTEDRFGLNDGFFSIDDFNRQSELLERQDAKGEPEEEDSSDEEVDWHTDPLIAGNARSTGKNNTSKQSHRPEEDDDPMDDSSEEEGPTFGNANLQGDSDSDSDDASNDGDATAWVNTSDIKYADFFAPPPRKVSSKKARALPKTQPDEKPTDDDVDRAMADVRRDLFDDESSVGDEDEGLDDSAEPHAQRSTHEKQRARIADEIRRLEAANVAKKEWMFAGEARAVERPVNSLIEEDLDFERIGKPVPIVTNETTEDIEELVKRRILAKEFDEVIRRRPGASDTQATRRSRFELDDSKPQQSLAELYETDHLRANDPNYVDTKDRKLMREHAEIANLWQDISSQLDTLSNWHYKPKAPQASINVVTDTPTIMMEEARPTAGSAAGGAAALAPQEVYTPGDDGRVAGELVLRSGAAMSKEEMSREEKARLRRQNKKNQKKANAEPTRQLPGKTADKQQIVSDLKKGGVKVVGKDGQMTDVNGGKVGAGARSTADTLKL
ncbi:U3 small nucleolar ribonucleoprotein Mpp10 [Penicillium alfredii]|uniref:U3 small nucleolar ribonucleoprotein protein MPP10 n=1 Tax=Penicillium alfredii TaxID=1506179 RepID=A0A9W9JTN5_9EURO|nr:U3 small nucleolar ribonucleoprotein Mpp10 [Penicillium alfredii]KAJ5081418.1 U3 small nucleolar ribonucleoprotein Mpp10 [Penicillium alfredii]